MSAVARTREGLRQVIAERKQQIHAMSRISNKVLNSRRLDLFEPFRNRQQIDRVQITVAETLGSGHSTVEELLMRTAARDDPGPSGPGGLSVAEKRKISLVLADVDGTLVTEEKVLTERARRAVEALHKAKIRFAITSGRPPRGMAMLFDALNLSTPIAGFNGGLFIERDLTILAERTVPVSIARAAIALIREQGLDAWVYRGNDWLITKLDAPHVAREACLRKLTRRVAKTLRAISSRSLWQETAALRDFDPAYVADGSLADKLPRTKTDFCPLWSNSGQNFSPSGPKASSSSSPTEECDHARRCQFRTTGTQTYALE